MTRLKAKVVSVGHNNNRPYVLTEHLLHASILLTLLYLMLAAALQGGCHFFSHVAVEEIHLRETE